MNTDDLRKHLPVRLAHIIDSATFTGKTRFLGRDGWVTMMRPDGRCLVVFSAAYGADQVECLAAELEAIP